MAIMTREHSAVAHSTVVSGVVRMIGDMHRATANQRTAASASA